MGNESYIVMGLKKERDKSAFVFCNRTQQATMGWLEFCQITIRGGEGDVFKMGEKRDQPACMATHRLVNQLSAIIGHCDLLIEMTEQGLEQAKHLARIRDIANTAAKELIEHQTPTLSGSAKTEWPDQR